MTARRAALALAAALLLGGLGLSAQRVFVHERGELEHESEPRSLAALARGRGATRVSARLTEVELKAGEHAVFELCASDALDAARWQGAFQLAVFRLPEMALMLRVPLDAAHLESVRRDASGAGACLKLGGGAIERDGRYSLDAVWPAQPPRAELQAVKLQARVLALRPLSPHDRAGVLAIGLGVALLLTGLLLPRAGAPRMADLPALTVDAVDAVDAAAVQRAPARVSLSRELLLGAVAIGALVLATRVPSAGATLTFAKGVGLVLLQAGAALLLARVTRPRAALEALAIAPPRQRLGYWLGFALLAAAGLVLAAQLALAYIPRTAEAPIQTFVSWPSGMLCFAALGVVLPLGEELFFRGYLYRIALGFGRAAAFWLTFALFLALHAEQSWGNWGGLVSIGMAGLALTGLRALSGSVLIPALAHVLYNFTLSMASF